MILNTCYHNKDKDFRHDICSPCPNYFFIKQTTECPKEPNKCPDCGKRLIPQPGGGVACYDTNCGYWFCF